MSNTTIFEKPVSTEIETLSDQITKQCEFGTMSSISSYNSKSNPYRAPSDGYICLYADNDASKVTFMLLRSDLSATIASITQNKTGSTFAFVKKGTRGYVSEFANSAAIRFYPIT